MKFGMCNEFCEGWDFASACELAARAGYDGIEVAPFTIKDSVNDVSRQEREALREIAGERGLEIVGLHWLLVKPEGLYINHPDDEIRRKTTDYMRALIDFCGDLGGTRTIVGSPKQRNVLDGQTCQETWDRTVEEFRKLAPRAESRGVILCIEPLAPSETNFINLAAEARCLVEAVDSPAFRMMLDVKAMHGAGEAIPDVIMESASYLEHFHANDANRQGPGFGETDFVPIAAALREAGYDGYVSVEVFDFSAGPERIADQSLRYLQEVFGD